MDNIALDNETNEKALLVDRRANLGLRRDGLAFHWWDSRPTSLHSHNYYEFFIVTSGEIEHLFNGKVEILPKGTMFFLSLSDVHRIVPKKGMRCIHMNLMVTEEKLRALCEALSVDFAAFIRLHGRYDLTGAEFDFFRRHAEAINLPAGEAARVTVIAELLFEAVALISTKHSVETLFAPDWFLSVLSRINSPDFIDKSAADVYALSDYSAPVIISYFKKYTGSTISKYLTAVKMSYAKNLLTTTDMTTLELSGRLGFDSLSHFNRVFKAHFQMTPTEMRKGER